MELIVAIAAFACLLGALVGGRQHIQPVQAGGPGYIPNSALILGSTVGSGTATAGFRAPLYGYDTRSLEEKQAILAGFTPMTVSDATWSSMAAADLATSRSTLLASSSFSVQCLASSTNSAWL